MHMFVYAYDMYTWMSACACIWRPDLGTRCLPQSGSALFSETGSLIDPRAHRFCEVGWSSSSLITCFCLYSWPWNCEPVCGSHLRFSCLHAKYPTLWPSPRSLPAFCLILTCLQLTFDIASVVLKCHPNNNIPYYNGFNVNYFNCKYQAMI